ncbi:MAG TPA: septation protein A [Planctomycetota bacterium]|nr:septation protein A [Planctomycetota bacterium]
MFFLLNARAGIYWATGAFMAAIVVSLVVSRVVEQRFPVMPLVTAVFVLVFGGLTLALQDELFIKLKPTIVNTLFGAILLGGLATGRVLLKPVFGAGLALDDAGWRALTLRFGLFFLFLAVLNEVVWRSVSTDAWVSFKVFGLMPLTFVFFLLQTPLLRRHALATEPGESPQP